MAKKKDKEAFSQMYLACALESEVQAWVDQGWPGLTQTSLQLFNYWFKRDEDTEERFYPCQQRAIETAVYCHEILNPANLQDLFEKVAPEALAMHLPLKQEVETIPFPKYALKMATGSGKTWVLAALLIWQYFNWLNGERRGKYSCRFLVVTPGHEVLNRMLDSFKGKRDLKTGNRDPQTSDYKRSLLVPESANWRERFHFEVLEPGDVRPNATSPEGPFVLITNWQQFRLKPAEASVWDQLTGADVEETPRGEIIADFLSEFPDLVIMNDEAHHVHGKETAKGDELVWRRFMNVLYERIIENHEDDRGVFIQFDYSATPFFGSAEKKEFFPHIIYDYNLVSAMNDMLVKQLFLEERQTIGGEDLEQLDFRAERNEPEAGHRRGEIKRLSAGQKLLLDIGRRKLEQLAQEFRAKGIEKKPVMMVLCENTKVANLTAEHFEGLTDERGAYYDTNRVMQIHTDLKDSKLKQARERLDLIDVDDDPLRVVISVLMLREGFDKNNICVVVVLRATEADLLLEQVVGRGLRLMFPASRFPPFQDSKRQAYEEIRANKEPSCSLDFLFVVEHPRFREFYEKLKGEGFVIGEGDTSKTTSTGDIIAVDAITELIPIHDIAWPVQVYEEGQLPDIGSIDISQLPKYGEDFDGLKKYLGQLVIQETHVESGKKTKLWKMDNKYFDYAHFLRQASRAVCSKGGSGRFTLMQAKVAEIIDDYVSEFCFGERIDFDLSENYQILNYPLVFDHVVSVVEKEILRLMEGFGYEVKKGVWCKLSDVPRIMVRESKSVKTEKSIYPRLGYDLRAGGFERDFMTEILEKSSDVLSYAKLDRRHKLKVDYRDDNGVLRKYELDFVIKTKNRMFLLETKADKDISNMNVAIKARAATAWCENAGTVPPPANLQQPQSWEYLLISEKLFRKNKGLSFKALVPLMRSLTNRVVAQAEEKLFRM